MTSKMNIENFIPSLETDDEVDYDSFEVTKLSETSLSICFVFHNGTTHCIPKSLLGDDSDDLDIGEEGYICIPVWKAEQIGLDDD